MYSLALALALAAASVFSPLTAQAQENAPGYTPLPTPEAADDTLGMAIMSVSVLAGCTDYRGSGVKSVTTPSTGICLVTFDREVRSCTVVASMGAYETTITIPGYTIGTNYISGDANDNVVEVRTYNGSDAAAIQSFHIIVFCWE